MLATARPILPTAKRPVLTVVPQPTAEATPNPSPAAVKKDRTGNRVPARLVYAPIPSQADSAE